MLDLSEGFNLFPVFHNSFNDFKEWIGFKQFDLYDFFILLFVSDFEFFEKV